MNATTSPSYHTVHRAHTRMSTYSVLTFRIFSSFFFFLIESSASMYYLVYFTFSIIISYMNRVTEIAYLHVRTTKRYLSKTECMKSKRKLVNSFIDAKSNTSNGELIFQYQLMQSHLNTCTSRHVTSLTCVCALLLLRFTTLKTWLILLFNSFSEWEPFFSFSRNNSYFRRECNEWRPNVHRKL